MQNMVRSAWSKYVHYVLEIELPVNPPPSLKCVYIPPPHFLASEWNLYALPLIPLSFPLTSFVITFLLSRDLIKNIRY